MIRSVAATRCGGERALQDAISNGEITTATNDADVELYFFPSMRLKTETRSSVEQSVKRTKLIDDEDVDAIIKSISSLGWFQPLPGGMQADCSGNAGGGGLMVPFVNKQYKQVYTHRIESMSIHQVSLSLHFTSTSCRDELMNSIGYHFSKLQ